MAKLEKLTILVVDDSLLMQGVITQVIDKKRNNVVVSNYIKSMKSFKL